MDSHKNSKVVAGKVSTDTPLCTQFSLDQADDDFATNKREHYATVSDEDDDVFAEER